MGLGRPLHSGSTSATAMEGPNRLRLLLVTASLLVGGMLTGSAEQITTPLPNRPNIPLGLDAYMPIPEDNPLTPEKVALGKKLFNDRILSRDRSISCATCHNPRRTFTDGRPVSVGVFGRKGPRNVPALVNRGYGKAFFWDGRAASLEEQALQPIENPNEFGHSVSEVIARLNSHPEYPPQFRVAFGWEVNAADLARALASYVRTILSGDAPADRFFAGDRDVFSPEARRGLDVFRGKGNCTACHIGPTFSDEQFHNTGVAWRPEVSGLLDAGRFAVSGKETDRGAFKTPTLRHVAETAPYMHDGSLVTLEEVVEFYNRGGRPNPHLDGEIRPLGLIGEEKHALIAFLKSLSGTIQEGIPRASPAPTLGRTRRSAPTVNRRGAYEK